MPGLLRVAVFWNPLNPAYGPILKELEAAAGPETAVEGAVRRSESTGWRVVYDPGPPPRWKQPIWLPVQSPHRASPGK